MTQVVRDANGVITESAATDLTFDTLRDGLPKFSHSTLTNATGEIVVTTERGPAFAGPLLIFGKPISLSSVSPGGQSEILPAALAMKLRSTRDPCLSRLNAVLKP